VAETLGVDRSEGDKITAEIISGDQAHAALLDYLQTLIESTRNSPLFIHGLSPRAALALLAVARAWAFIDGRSMVLPEDVQAVLPGVACHRLRLVNSASHSRPEDIARLIHATPVA
jgi:MoxR-like ATPase